ncbi:hypothetical protein NQ317_004610 [Molorchus minor]|uniref:Uncharacterized protein n=1 Tax=Molorchus minor TaxID=1323400 RepID=A0ABQ9J667_9CUCU|nr:hypothetical protein NQ317_004610 [Molorchus minor]
MAAPSKVQMLAQSQSKAALAGQPSAVVLDGEGLQSVTEIVGSKSKITALQADPKREKRKKKKRDKKRQHAFEIPGVKKMTLSELAQKIIGCTAGDTVTSEKPWIYVDKELLVDNLELHEESSEFLPLKGELLKYPRKELLVGYIPDESRDYDEFYICLTEEATDIVNDVIEKMKTEQEERLYNSVNKVVGEWIPQGTEEEVDDGIMKNSRPLIEVEVETKYPIFPNKIEFRTVPAEQRRDGYMELRCADESIVNVYKRRIDACVQVAPQVISAEAQTNCTYPTNSTTEYLYEIAGDPVKIMERCTPGIVKYAENNMDNVSDMLTVNSVINLYTDDYRALCADPSAKKAKATALETVTENMLFMDVNMCKGKMVADAAWHPMWTGTVAIAYANFAPNVYLSGQNTDDLVSSMWGADGRMLHAAPPFQVHKAVFDSNPVLMWSTKDVLRPKLILESPREAFKLSFCAFDENILVGGLKNGQIIIWDIRNKLTKVEELEVLTANQQKYRAHMNSLMGWMKDIHDLALVRPTALSDLKHSHKSAITGITWMSPYHEYSRLGKLDEIPEEEERFSMQFLTCSKDGTICIWDLLKKPKVQPGGFKIKKLKRLKKKPSALLVDVSPFKILHMNLRPIYRLRVPRGEEKTKIVAMAGCTENYFRMRYVEKNPVRGRKISIEDRIYYKPVLHFEDTAKEPEPELYIGSMEGEVIVGLCSLRRGLNITQLSSPFAVPGDCAHLSWEGQDFESGEVVNSQLCKILNVAKYHDGPVCVIKKCPETDAILTVGGKTFAIWRDDFKGRPVLWRRGGHMYTAGDWNPFQVWARGEFSKLRTSRM